MSPTSVVAPLVADAVSSTILSRPLDVSRFGIIYAGAQKNIGPSGLVLLIVREEDASNKRARVTALRSCGYKRAGR